MNCVIKTLLNCDIFQFQSTRHLSTLVARRMTLIGGRHSVRWGSGLLRHVSLVVIVMSDRVCGCRGELSPGCTISGLVHTK